MPSFAALTAAGLVLSLSSAVDAHFNLLAPPPIGFDEGREATGPCGGFTPDFSKNNVTDFHVGGDAIATALFHPQANILYRATVDTSAASGWQQLFPILQQSGLNNLCEPSVPAPAAWAGKQGIVSVVVNAPDGILYQCAAVRFVNGTGTPGSACQNGTATASFTTDSSLASLVSNGPDYCNTTNSSSGGGGKNGAAGLSPAPFPYTVLAVAVSLVGFGTLFL